MSIDCTVAAVVFDVEGILASEHDSAARIRSRLEELSRLGVHVAALSDGPVESVEGLFPARASGRGLLLLALDRGSELYAVTHAGPELLHRRTDNRATDLSDSMRDVMGRLLLHGVAGELVLVVGDAFGRGGTTPGRDAQLLVPEARGAHAVSVGTEPEGVPPRVRHLGGGPRTFVRLLDEQLDRARRHRVPGVCLDPRWTIVEPRLDLARLRVTESLFTLTSGGVGVRGSVEEAVEFGHPLLVASGVYGGTGADDGLLAGPDPIDVGVTPPVTDHQRVLDLRTGVLYRCELTDHTPPLRSLRFGSVNHPGVIALRLEAPAGRLDVPHGSEGHLPWTVTSEGPGGIGALSQQDVRSDGMTTLERLVAVEGRPHGAPRRSRAVRRLSSAAAVGFEGLLAEHRAAWAHRWRSVDVSIPDDPETELSLRFSLFHLWGLCSPDPEIAVGARGLTGSGYSGHVFWDADVFVLPALATIDPASSRAMVRYRLNRLDAARRRARSEGRRGARYPWESASSGDDVTPTAGWVGSESAPILTGTLEEHITADVAWAMHHNATWCRPTGALQPAERRLLAETARYWSSRVRSDGSGVHLDGVIGPDEYHERVDDNAFTNGMVRWNLRTAARWGDAADTERREWRRLAEEVVDGYDPTTRLYEQFRGYFDLEPLQVDEFAVPPVAADVLLGRARIAGSQVIKQPDVLMLHVLIPEDTQAGSLRPNLDYYAPRTAQGSSLSPASMALLYARAGRPETARDLLRRSLRIDLDDIGGTTSAGVHIGSCGGAWQAVLHGFLGARVDAGTLVLDPVLPERWANLAVRFRCLGRDVVAEFEDGRLTVTASGPLSLRVVPTNSFEVRADPPVRVRTGGSP